MTNRKDGDHGNRGDKPKMGGVGEIMDRFSISRSTVNRMVKKGLPCLWIGAGRRFNVAQVVEWLEEQQWAA